MLMINTAEYKGPIDQLVDVTCNIDVSVERILMKDLVDQFKLFLGAKGDIDKEVVVSFELLNEFALLKSRMLQPVGIGFDGTVRRWYDRKFVKDKK